MWKKPWNTFHSLWNALPRMLALVPVSPWFLWIEISPFVISGWWPSGQRRYLSCLSLYFQTPKRELDTGDSLKKTAEWLEE
jgi:hypothetical protein